MKPNFTTRLLFRIELGQPTSDELSATSVPVEGKSVRNASGRSTSTQRLPVRWQ